MVWPTLPCPADDTLVTAVELLAEEGEAPELWVAYTMDPDDEEVLYMSDERSDQLTLPQLARRGITAWRNNLGEWHHEPQLSGALPPAPDGWRWTLQRLDDPQLVHGAVLGLVRGPSVAPSWGAPRTQGGSVEWSAVVRLDDEYQQALHQAAAELLTAHAAWEEARAWFAASVRP